VNNNEFAASGNTGLDAFQHIGQITRQLHESLNQLGITPKLRRAFDGMPDAGSRLDYIAQKTGEAANKVLASVELAKDEQARLALAARRALEMHSVDGQPQDTVRALLDLARQVETATASTDRILTDIMLAQDFHDLTGQVIARVVGLGTELRSSLVELLARAHPTERARRAEVRGLTGPIVPGIAAVDVVQDQAEVDDLLASLDF
jgi:chemotaxis protein CheZ